MVTLDYVILGFLGTFAVMGFIRGFVNQMISLVAIVGGFFVAKLLYRDAALFLHFDFEHGALVAFAAVFLATFIAVKIVGMLVEYLLKAMKLSLFNRIMGLFLGVLKGGVLSILLVYLLFSFYPGGDKLVSASPAGRYFLKAGKQVMSLLPEDMKKKMGFPKGKAVT